VTSAKALPAPTEFAVARGAHVGVVRPADGFVPSFAVKWEEFADLFLNHTVRENKDGPYICRPMKGDGTRKDANADAWPLLPLDLDELQAEDLEALNDWCKTGPHSLLSTTFSHTTESPRVRLWVRCSRMVEPVEHSVLQTAFASIFPWKLDKATAKPSQPLFLPSCPPARSHLAFAAEFEGKPLDVDRMLSGYQDVLKERAQRTSGSRFAEKTGVRAPGGTIDAFNKNFDLAGYLEDKGYKRKGRNRYVAPGSHSKRAAVVLYPETGAVYSFHDPAHDPLSRIDAFGETRPHDAFSALCALDFDNEFIPAFKEARRQVRDHRWDPSSDDEPMRASGSPRSYLIDGVLDSINKLERRDMVIEGMLEKSALLLVTGNSNSGKTTVLQYMALCISQGVRFGDHDVMPGPVLWIAGEDQFNVRVRFAATMERMGINPKDANGKLFVLPQRVAVLDKDSMDLLHGAIERDTKQRSFAAIIIDSKSMCWGGEDENSNDENADFVGELARNFGERYGAAVLVTHHLTKHKEKEEQSARGAGSLINNLDHEWRFEQPGMRGICVLAPGAKLRIAPWTDMRFRIETHTLGEKEYPHLKNNLGQMPVTSVAVLAILGGASLPTVFKDSDMAKMLAAIETLPSAGLRRDRGATRLTELLGLPMDEESKARSRDWVRRKLRLALVQKLIDSDTLPVLTAAGRLFLEDNPPDDSELTVDPEGA